VKGALPKGYSSLGYDGMIHGFFGMSAVLDQGKKVMDDACAALLEAFESP